MGPKKKENVVVDNRSPIDIETDLVTEQLKSLETQIQTCKDGIGELAFYVVRVKQLETELTPKEAEHKNILAAFQRQCESASSLKRALPQGDDLSSSTIRQSSSAAAFPSPPAVDPTSARRGTVADLLANTGSGNSPPGTASQDAASKEALKALMAVTKNAVTSILTSVFDTPLTPMEKAAAELQETAAAAAAVPDPAAIGAPPSTAPANSKRQSTNILLDSPPRPYDPDLVCPLGIESSVFSEVSRLRLNRMACEASIKIVSEQLQEAHRIVDKRRDEGASKLLLKKLEKQLDDTKKRLAELGRLKAEEDLLAKSNIGLGSPLPPRERSAGKSRGK
jgi:hypothetical protein